MKIFTIVVALVLLPFAFKYLVQKPAAWLEAKLKSEGAK